MEENYVLLTEKDAMWAEMLTDVLKDHQIPCLPVPIHGAGMVMKTGVRERIRIYVSPEDLPEAAELMHGLFPGEIQQ